MKIGVVYTSTTPELIKMVNEELEKNLGNSIELINYEDPSILVDVRKVGSVSTKAAAKLVSMFMQSVNDDVDVILNCCSSVGEVVDATKNLSKYIGVPIVRIDEEMCREAVRLGNKIGVLATLQTTLEPTKNTIKRVARELGREVELVDGLIDGAFGINQNEFKIMLENKTNEIINEVDVILLCQGSMAYAEEHLYNKYKKPVLSSPRFGAMAVKKSMEEKGLC